MAKQTTIEDIPVEAIEEAAKSYEQVSLRVTRRNDKGQVASITNGLLLPLMDLLTVDSKLREIAGGGRYRIEARDPSNPTQYVVPAFWVSVEGPPKRPQFLDAPSEINPSYPTGGGFTGGAPDAQSSWYRGVDQRRYGADFYRDNGRPAPGATVASDQLAIREMAELKGKLGKMEAKLEADKLRYDQERKRLERELADQKEKVAAQAHQGELALLRAELQAMRAIQERPVERGNSLEGWAALAAALAPVFSAHLTSSREGATRGLELQMQGMNNLMQAQLAQTNKDPEWQNILTTVGPLVMPIIAKMLDDKSPAAQAQLFQAMAENNLNSVAMMAQLVEAMASQGGEDPWYVNTIREALGGVINMTEAYLGDQKDQPGAPTTPSPQLVPPGGGYSTYDPAAEQAFPVELVDGPPPPDAVPIGGSNGASELSSKHRMMLTMLPKEFQTPEWRQIVTLLHTTKDIEKVSALAAGHLEHLINFGLLPEPLKNIVREPFAALAQLIGPLPISTEDPSFVETVVEHVVGMLAEDGYVNLPEPEENLDEVEDSEPEKVQPAVR